MFCFLLLFPKKTLHCPEESREAGGEYKAGEVYNKRAEKVVPFLKCIKILHKALIYCFAACFPFAALEAVPRSRYQERSVGTRNESKCFLTLGF